MNVLLYSVFLSLFAFSWGKSKDPNNFLDLDPHEKNRFEAFKSQVSKNFEGLDEFTKSDSHLIRFLRAKRFHVQEAVAMYNKHLRWRKANQLDGIHEEDWSDMAEDNPVYQDGFDKHGRPIYYAASGAEWEISEANRQGKLDRFLRWAGIKAIDYIVREAYKHNQSQFVIVDNLDGFTTRRHLCGLDLCTDLYTDFFRMYEENYPESMHKAYMVNTPLAFNTALNAIYPVMSAITKKNFYVFGRDKEEWEPVVYATIDRDQLNEDVGGTRKRGKFVSGKRKRPEPELLERLGV